jgi:DNA topoisomerase-1
MAIAWVRKLETPYVNDPLFVSNFTRSLVEEISKNKEYILEITAKITDFDFSSIKDHIQRVKAKKEGMSKEERKLDLVQRKEVREKLKDKYGYAFIDGLKVPLMNWTSEPSAIFMAKGLNKFRGCWKRSVSKKDITLNMSKIPEDSEDWDLIVWRPKEMWIASWKSPLDGRMKYVWLAQSTQLRQEKERKKFELALKLQDDLDRLEVIIDRELDGGTLERRKIAMVVYLMKNLALRVGDEKIAGEFGTVGCTTLKKENVRLEGNTLHLSFKGKDYVQWDKSMILPKLVKENLKEFLGKAGDDFIFKGINSEKTASFLREITPGASAKVFRTCIAGKTWEEHAKTNLNMIHDDTSDEIKKYLFKMTNLEVAKKLNHKRALPKGYDERKERIRLKLEVESNKLKEMYSKKTDFAKIAAQERKTEKLAVSWDLIVNTAEWSLGTSLASYISPEKVIHFVEESELEPEDVYSKALQEKYSWAIKRKE